MIKSVCFIKIGLFVIAVMLHDQMVYGQLKIKGSIQDFAQNPITNATLILLKEGNKRIQNTFSDQSGNFVFSSLTAGRYVIEASYMGNKMYSDLFSMYRDTIMIISMKKHLDVSLKEVAITTNKPLMERKIDRMVFNLENSISAKGTDLAEALAMTPMLRVNSNGVSIIGKGAVSVMINERMLNLSGTDLLNYLKSLRSDDVAKIEVITTPPAKYEAQGNSGLINIVMKKNLSMGWSGSLSTSYAQNTYASIANNLSLNYQSVKWSNSLRLRQYHRTGKIEEDNHIIGMNSILSHDPRKTRSDGGGVNLSMDYKVSRVASIGLIYDLGKSDYNVNLYNTTQYRTNSHIDSLLSTVSENRNPVFNQMLNVYYDQKLDTAGKKISTGFNFFSNAPETNNLLQTISDQSNVADFAKTYSGIKYRIWSAQTDLTLPLSWVSIESGLKFTNFENHSDVKYFQLVQDDYRIDFSRSNLFEYNEKNVAGYISGQKDLDKYWAVKAGLRYEYSITDGYSPTVGEQNQSKYGKWFPTVYITYKPNQKNTLSFNYSRRINRPNFRAVNPFRWYSNPYSYYTGNPLLKPSYNHNVELSYLFKGILSFTLYGQKLIDGYGYITTLENGLKVVNSRNYLTQYSTGLIVTMNFEFFPWWENSSYMSLNASSSKSEVPDVIAQNGFGFNYSTNNTFLIHKQIAVFLNFSQVLPSTQGNTYRESQYNFSSGCRVSMANNRLQLNASVYKGALEKVTVYFKDFKQQYRTDYDYNTLNLGLTYIFGRSKVKGNTKKRDFKETQRAN